MVQTKLHNLKSRVGEPDPQFLHWIRACSYSQSVWKQNGILSFINLYFVFLRTYLSYKQYMEKKTIKLTTNVSNYIRPFCDII